MTAIGSVQKSTIRGNPNGGTQIYNVACFGQGGHNLQNHEPPIGRLIAQNFNGRIQLIDQVTEFPGRMKCTVPRSCARLDEWPNIFNEVQRFARIAVIPVGHQLIDAQIAGEGVTLFRIKEQRMHMRAGLAVFIDACSLVLNQLHRFPKPSVRHYW